MINANKGMLSMSYYIQNAVGYLEILLWISTAKFARGIEQGHYVNR